MSGTLFVVATPIGNLEDITLRALRVLREVAVIAAEDTRRTARLLVHHGISTPTVSFHDHNIKLRLPQLLARLTAGEDIAVVTDAGTPGVSDPGVELVQACIAHAIKVDPIPGASAVLTALVGSGCPTDEVLVLGFPPAKGNARKEWVQRVATAPQTIVCLESPHRIVSLIEALATCCGDRPIVIARELTKVHQQFLRGTATEILAKLGEPRGEFTLVLGPLKSQPREPGSISDAQLRLEFGQLTDTDGMGRRAAIVALSRRHGWRPRDIYARLEEIKNSGD